jgi:hypothetical protein
MAKGHLTKQASATRTALTATVRSRAASRAAPRSSGGATNSGVSEPCSRTAHGVNRVTAGVSAAASAPGEAPDGPRSEQPGEQLQRADRQPQPADRIVDRQDAASDEEQSRRLGGDHLAVNVMPIEQQPRGEGVHALVVVPHLEPPVDVQRGQRCGTQPERHGGSEPRARGMSAARCHTRGRAMKQN